MNDEAGTSREKPGEAAARHPAQSAGEASAPAVALAECLRLGNAPTDGASRPSPRPLLRPSAGSTPNGRAGGGNRTVRGAGPEHLPGAIHIGSNPCWEQSMPEAIRIIRPAGAGGVRGSGAGRLVLRFGTQEEPEKFTKTRRRVSKSPSGPYLLYAAFSVRRLFHSTNPGASARSVHRSPTLPPARGAPPSTTDSCL